MLDRRALFSAVASFRLPEAGRAPTVGHQCETSSISKAHSRCTEIGNHGAVMMLYLLASVEETSFVKRLVDPLCSSMRKHSPVSQCVLNRLLPRIVLEVGWKIYKRALKRLSDGDDLASSSARYRNCSLSTRHSAVFAGNRDMCACSRSFLVDFKLDCHFKCSRRRFFLLVGRSPSFLCG